MLYTPVSYPLTYVDVGIYLYRRDLHSTMFEDDSNAAGHHTLANP